MHFFEIEGRRYAQFENLRRIAGVVHAFSTRPGDVSIRGDETCAARRQQMALDFRRDPSRLACCGQVHTPRIMVIDECDGTRILQGYDAVCTHNPATTLMTFSADCPLVVLFDPRRAAVGLAHASWRCTVAAIVPGLIETMRKEFGSRPADLSAGIGPSAGPEAYEVGEDVYAAAEGLPERDSCFPKRDGRMYFDLWRANRLQLEAAGVSPANIEIAEVCTMTRTDLFYSYRREGRGCGHFGLMAGVGEKLRIANSE
jgi:polyphenol oxidase